MAPATVAYTGYLVATAVKGDPLEIMAAIVPCTWSYGDIGSSLLAEGRRARPPCVRGVDPLLRRSGLPSDRRRDAGGLRAQWPADADEATVARLSEIFTMSTRLELGFWDMAYDLVQWPDATP